MKIPEPKVGLVVRYSFLWSREATAGLEEGSKDRPCAIVLIVRNIDGALIVRVLPITTRAPHDLAKAMEIPLPTKLRIGLDEAKSWVILAETNEFEWPGPDLRPASRENRSTPVLGMLPPGFTSELLRRLRERSGIKIITRT